MQELINTLKLANKSSRLALPSVLEDFSNTLNDAAGFVSKQA